jgi:hypothetical protein
MSSSTNNVSKTIEITVSPEGAVSIKTTGFTGSACKDATRELERALGVIRKETLLPEFHLQQTQQSRLSQGS